MAKTNDAARKPQTHFEQIPLDVVKKIAEEHVPKDNKAGIDSGGVEPTSRKKG